MIITLSITLLSFVTSRGAEDFLTGGGRTSATNLVANQITVRETDVNVAISAGEKENGLSGTFLLKDPINKVQIKGSELFSYCPLPYGGRRLIFKGNASVADPNNPSFSGPVETIQVDIYVNTDPSSGFLFRAIVDVTVFQGSPSEHTYSNCAPVSPGHMFYECKMTWISGNIILHQDSEL